ncbi:MAG: DUF362 domain-containing protein [Methanomassiliicoccus sp.]|nr:DUF362 domain-containing protein [Methanomassiliicoccus sp.]
MAASKVSLVRCQDYDPPTVETAVKSAVHQLGGVERYVKPGERVLLKPNLLLDAPPEDCVTTHPTVVRAAARLFLQHGCTVTIADSPGSFLPYTRETLARVYKRCGMLDIAEELGVELNLNVGFREIANERGKVLKEFKVIDPPAEADAIIVISKLKTHLATGLTGGAKNLYGIVPGLEKKALHARYRTPGRFADVIVDLNERIRPRLQIMDAVMTMEGDGPNTGTPRAMNAILGSDSPYALDAIAARLANLDPLRVTTVRAASRRHLIDVGSIEVAGERIEKMAVPGFVLPSTFAGSNGGTFASLLSSLSLDRARPMVSGQSCRGCGACARSCPVDAINVVERKASIDRKKCIECYCCHEMCSSKAIKLEKSMVGRTIDRIVAGPGSGP